MRRSLDQVNIVQIVMTTLIRKLCSKWIPMDMARSLRQRKKWKGGANLSQRNQRCSHRQQSSNSRASQRNTVRSRAEGVESMKAMASMSTLKMYQINHFRMWFIVLCRSSEIKSKSFVRSTDICLLMVRVVDTSPRNTSPDRPPLRFDLISGNFVAGFQRRACALVPVARVQRCRK